MNGTFGKARKQFDDLVSRSLSEGPQRVCRGGRTVIVVAEHDYLALTGKLPSFKEFLLGKGPSLKGLDLSRDASPMREI